MVLRNRLSRALALAPKAPAGPLASVPDGGDDRGHEHRAHEEGVDQQPAAHHERELAERQQRYER